MAKNVKKLSPDKEESIRICMENSGLPREKILKEMHTAYTVFGIGHREFTKKKLYGMSEVGMARRLLHLDRKKKAQNKLYERIEKVSGLSPDQVDAELIAIKELTSFPDISLKNYYRSGLCRLSSAADKDKITEKVELIREIGEIKQSFRNELHRIDLGESGYGEADRIYRQSISMIVRSLDKSVYASAKKKLLPLLDPQDASRINEYTSDMFAAEELLGFQHYEYKMFMLYRHDLKGKREFISDAEKTKLVKMGGSAATRRLLDDKYESYKVLKKYYRRELLKLTDRNYAEFVRFCKGHPVFVKKNSYDSLGRGIMKVNVRNYESVQKVYEDITQDIGNITVEELIIPHETIRQLNPSSVNTVRVIVCKKAGSKPVIVDTFMKIGRDGSFVDNGGAGGILVHIDPDTGVFDSNGVDESGTRYEKHPDHSYMFKGYALPKWNKLIKISKKAINNIEGLGYVGWDFTFNSKGKWIIIEGNSGSQLIGPQGTTLVGIKHRVCEAIGYNEADFTKPKEEDIS